MSINRWIYPDAEAVLMILGKSTRTDDVAPVRSFALVDIDNRHDAGSSGLDVDSACLVEFVGEDVLVVCQSDDELHYELTATSNHCSTGSPVSVLPVDAIILFMNANDVGCCLTLAVWADNNTVEILDNA